MSKYKTKISMTNTQGEIYEVKSFTSCKVNKNITNAISSFSFSVDSFDIENLAENFGIGTAVDIFQGEEDNLIHTISGWINQEPRKLNGLIRTIDYAGVDYTGRLQYKIVNEAYAEMDVGEIVADLMKKYAPEYTTEIYSTGFSVAIKYNKVFLFDCLKDLANLVSFDFFIDTNKVFKFIPVGYTSTGRIIKTGEFKKGTGQFNRDASKLVNKLLVAGGLVESSPTQDRFIYDVNMNNFMTTRYKPKAVLRPSQFFDNKTEYAWKRTEGFKDLTGKYGVNQVQTFLITNPIPYNEDIDQLTIEWKGILNLKTGATFDVYDLFREYRPDGYYNARGFGLHHHVGAVKFYVYYGEGADEKIEVQVSENEIPHGTEVSIQCRWFGKKIEMYINGELRAEKEHSTNFDIYYDNNRTASWAQYEGTFISKYQDSAVPNEIKLSWVSRSETELKPFVNPNELTSRVWVYKNGFQLRTGIDNLQDAEKYDVVYSYNDKSFAFHEDLGLKNDDVIDIHYCYEYNIMDIIENKPSQQKYGVFEDKLVINNNLREYVKAQAHKHLQKYAKPVVSGSLEPFDLTFKVGELVNLEIPELSIDEANIKITSVEYSSKPSFVQCKIGLETEANVSQLFANIIKRVEYLEAEKFYNEEEEIQQLEKFTEDCTFIEEYEITEQTTANFVFDGCNFDFAEFVE